MHALILSPFSSVLPQFHLEYGASVLPHPAKARGGGEDAHLMIGRLLRARREREVTGAFAVFDGVGAWVNEGVDAGLFSRALARRTRDALSRQSWASSLDLTAALSAGLRATHEVGSATACLLSLDRSGVLPSDAGAVHNGATRHLLLIARVCTDCTTKKATPIAQKCAANPHAYRGLSHAEK